MTRTSSYIAATIPALVVLGFFVWFANWIPQTRWDPPTKQEIGAAMVPTQLAKIGQTIVRQRGCLACHTIEPTAGVKGQGRGPNLANIAARRAKGVEGGPKVLADYLVETLYDPGAFLVDGYANIMPVSTSAPAKLSYEEVVAVVNYLQSLGGTPSVRVGDIARPTGRVAAAAPSTSPEAILVEYNCAVCHRPEPGEDPFGPPFDATLLRQAAAERGVSAEAYVMEAIVDPLAVERGDFPKGTMPQDFGEQLTAGQLQAMVTYLLAPEGRR
jgi:mono/diheme cytochrome c family protein